MDRQIKHSMKRRLLSLRNFQRLLNVSGFFAQKPYLNPITRVLMRIFADLTVKIKGGQRKESLEEIAKEWQRMFPGRRMVPITEITEETAFAGVHTPCPVSDTGDVHACYRLMEYDRRLLEHIGGEFVVLESQASPNIQKCRVAIRKKGASLTDLIPAHER